MFHQNLSNPRIFKALSKDVLYDLQTGNNLPGAGYRRTTPRYTPELNSVLTRGRPRRFSISSRSTSSSSSCYSRDPEGNYPQSRPISAATTATLGLGHRFPSTTTLNALIPNEAEHKRKSSIDEEELPQPKPQKSAKQLQLERMAERERRNSQSQEAQPNPYQRYMAKRHSRDRTSSSTAVAVAVANDHTYHNPPINGVTDTVEPLEIRKISPRNVPLPESPTSARHSEHSGPEQQQLRRNSRQVSSHTQHIASSHAGSRFSLVQDDMNDLVREDDYRRVSQGYEHAYEPSNTGPYGQIRYEATEKNKRRKVKDAIKRFSCSGMMPQVPLSVREKLDIPVLRQSARVVRAQASLLTCRRPDLVLLSCGRPGTGGS